MALTVELKSKNPDIWANLEHNSLVIDGVAFVCLNGNGTEAHETMCKINKLLAHREWIITRLQFDIVSMRDTLKHLEHDVLE